jgi:hypothetical protein
MPEVPSPREFGRILRRMDLPARARLSDLAGKSKLAKDPAEAALVVAAVRRAMRTRSWGLGMQILLIPMVIVNSVRIQGSVDWSAALLLLVIAISIPMTLMRNRRSLLQAERLNRKLASESP